MKRITGTVVALAVLALFGCGGGGDTASEAPTIQVSTGGEEEAYQTAAFAQQRAEWEALAEQGDARSQRELGVMYYLGQGMDPDYAKAAEWLGKSAEQGDDVAQMTIGVLYAEGLGVPQSKVNAHKWLSLAARQGNSNAKLRLDALAATMTADQIAEAKRLAEEWTPTL